MQPSISTRTLVLSIIGILALGINIQAATVQNRYVTNADGTALEIVVGANSVDFGTGDNRSTLFDDLTRIPAFPVIVLRPVLTNTSMVLDLMPSGAGNAVTNTGAPFLAAIDLVNRDLDHVPDPANWVAARLAISSNAVIVGSAAGGTSNSYQVFFVSSASNATPFSFVFQSVGGAPLFTNAWFSQDGSFTVKGTTNGGTPPTGFVGEFLAVTNNFATGTNLTTAVDTNALKLTLTSGDWLVFGHATFASATATAKGTQIKASIGLVNNTVNNDGTQVYNWPNVTNNAFTASVSLSTPTRVNVTTSTTIFLNANAIFTAGTWVVYGEMEATRIR